MKIFQKYDFTALKNILLNHIYYISFILVLKYFDMYYILSKLFRLYFVIVISLNFGIYLLIRAQCLPLELLKINSANSN